MRTPAGQECRYYYQDFHRGRNLQECRLIKENPESLRWKPSDCAKCPVPAILSANASPNMQLTLTAKAGFLGLGRRLVVTAECKRHGRAIEDPFVGCPECNAERPGLDIFYRALGDVDDEQDTNAAENG